MGDLDKNPAVKAMVVFRKAMRTIEEQLVLIDLLKKFKSL